MMATFVARCSWLIVPTTMLVTPEVLSTKFRFFLRLYSLKRPLFNAFFTRTPLFFDSAFYHRIKCYKQKHNESMSCLGVL